jgi:hypothetical protein
MWAFFMIFTMIYCHMSSEIIQSVAYVNCKLIWNNINFMFSQKFISLFSGLFNDESDIRVVQSSSSPPCLL